MLKWLSGLVLGGCCLVAQADMDFQTFRKLTHSLLKIEAANPDGSISMGTGVIVGKGMVVTNCHVTQRAKTIELVKGSLRQSVQSQYSDIDHDLCLLYSPHVEDEQVATLSAEEPRLGQAVYAIGFIFGIAPRLNAGEISALYRYDGGTVIQSTTPFTSGASGGGLFDERGRLIGIVTFKSRGSVAHHFSMPVSWVVERMKRFDAQPVAPLIGSTFWQRSTLAQPFFLRVAALEVEQRWAELVTVARQWADAEPRNATAWHSLGKAHHQLRQNDLSLDAYRNAVAIDAGDAAAWYGLGLVHAGSGNRAWAARLTGERGYWLPGTFDRLHKLAHECINTAVAVC